MPTTSEQFAKSWPIVFIPYFLGPSLSSILLTGLVYGKAGFRELFSRLLRWRAGVSWYAIALLTAPLLATLILLALSLYSSEFLPGILKSDNRVSLILLGIVTGVIFGGLLEELGWTGLAVPELRRRNSVFRTGLAVGFLWGLWHFLPTYWGSGNSSEALDWLLLLPPCLFYVGVLSAYRILMVWVFDRTKSWFVIMLMHASLTASTLFILAPSAKVISLIVYYLILTALVWIIVAGVAIVNRWQFSHQSLLKQTA
jgi:membrane protease YdiL (CAAX protease family)